MPILIAHRGDTTNFEENTIDAFQSAFDKGADGVEMDVQLIDGELCVAHDYLADPAKTYPTLSDVLNAVGKRGHVEIEVKAFSLDILKPLDSMLRSFQITNLEITTSELALLPSIARQFPNTPIGAIFDQCQYQSWMTKELYCRKLIGHMTLLGATVAHLSHLPEDKLTASLIAALHEQGYRAHYHIFRQEMEKQVALYTKLGSLDVDQCTFDDIDLLSFLHHQ